MALENLIAALGDEITDPEEETFLLFSHPIPSQNLGFVDAKATDLELTVAGRDLNITQSPGLLSSNRAGGTTGAVVWKITPLFAEWIAREDNILFKQSVLNSSSVVLELGCGISGIVGIVLGPKISKCFATDQEYVFKLLKSNIDSNAAKPRNLQQAKKKPKGNYANYFDPVSSNIEVVALDWESSSVSELPNMIDAVIACDCIYNEALVEPFVRTCAEICQLTTASGKRTMCIIAQQLRSNTVFEAWLSAFHEVFRVWRVPDEVLNEGLRGGSGFIVHVAVLR